MLTSKQLSCRLRRYPRSSMRTRRRIRFYDAGMFSLLIFHSVMPEVERPASAQIGDSAALAKNRRTLLREAEQFVGSKYVDQVLDSLYVIERSAQHFFIRAEMGKNAGRRSEEVDEDYKQAASLAALAAPYRHARLSAVKLASSPTDPMQNWDKATAQELRAEIMQRLSILSEAGVIDLEALPPPKRRIAN